MRQTFLIGPEPRVNIVQVNGDLTIHGWDQREIQLDWEGEADTIHQEGNVLNLAQCHDDIELWVPYETTVSAETLGGDAEAKHIRRIELKNINGDVKLEDIGIDVNLENSSEAIALVDIAGDLDIKKASSLRARRNLGSDVRLEDVALVEIEKVGADLRLKRVGMISIGGVGGDLIIDELDEAMRCGFVGADCHIGASAQADINLGSVGADLKINSAIAVSVGNVGGDCQIRNVQGNVGAGNIGSGTSISNIGGDLRIGRIGADAQLQGLQGSVQAGVVGGDLELQASFSLGNSIRLRVEGDAEVTLPADANLTLQAIVGGTISGSSISLGGRGNQTHLVYGEGMSQAFLSVGGDLEIRGGNSPKVSSMGMPWGEFGQEMTSWSQDFGREFTGIFSDLGWQGASWAGDVVSKVNEHMRRSQRKAEQQMKKAEEHIRRNEERMRHRDKQTKRFRVQVNEREWQMNPDRFNDLLTRAQQAAVEGVNGALEAVERSISNLRTPGTPFEARPPHPDMPPTPSEPPESFSSPAPVVSNGEKEEVNELVEDPDLEKEREAILRMIAEGRISSEEGDMLLEGLGN